MDVVGEEDGSDDGEVGGDDSFKVGDFEVEAKVFACRRSDGVFVIGECHKRWERKLLLSRGQLLWIGDTLLSRSKLVGVLRQKEMKAVDGEEVFAIEGRNTWGSFISFHVSKGPATQNFVVFPAGKKGYEWFRASQWIKGCVSKDGESSGEPVSAQDGIPDSAPVVLVDNQRRSFADVARCVPANSCPSFSLQDLETKLSDLENHFTELSLKLDKVLDGMCHLRSLDLPSREEGREEPSPGKNGGFESFDFHLASGDNTNCWGSMLSLEELRGYPYLNPKNGNLVGLPNALVPTSLGRDFRRSGVDNDADEPGCERISEPESETNIPADASPVEVSSKMVSLTSSEYAVVSCATSLDGNFGSCHLNFEFPTKNPEDSGQPTTPVNVQAASGLNQGHLIIDSNEDNMESGVRKDDGDHAFENDVQPTPDNVQGANRLNQENLIIDSKEDNVENGVCRDDGDHELENDGCSKVMDSLVGHVPQELLSRWMKHEFIITGETLTIGGEVLDGVAILKRLVPPLRTRKSRVAFQIWRDRIGAPFLVKLREAGFDIGPRLYDPP